VTRSPAVPYTAPFAVFVGFIALASIFRLPVVVDEFARIIVVTAVIAAVSRPVLDFHFRQPAWSVAIGVLIFAIWILPDELFPGYRESALFRNALTGVAGGSLPEKERQDSFVLTLRTVRAVLVVPIAEELFWRGWLIRWFISPDFLRVPPGKFEMFSFCATTVLFASEHGPYWDVGLAAGIIFNAWMIRTKRLGDLILAHAAANACLSAYIIVSGKWEYWL
jgi:CAAX prenyl protease-like protein